MPITPILLRGESSFEVKNPTAETALVGSSSLTVGAFVDALEPTILGGSGSLASLGGVLVYGPPITIPTGTTELVGEGTLEALPGTFSYSNFFPSIALEGIGSLSGTGDLSFVLGVCNRLLFRGKSKLTVDGALTSFESNVPCPCPQLPQDIIMANMSDYLEVELLGASLGLSTYTSPATVYAALFLTDPTDADAGVEVGAGVGYARLPVTWNAISSVGTVSQSSNAADLVWGPATGSWGTVTHIGLYDALTGGNLLWHGPLPAPITFVSGAIWTQTAGSLIVQLG